MDLTSAQKNLLVLGAVVAGILWLSKRGQEKRLIESHVAGAKPTDFEKRVEGMRRSFNDEELEPSHEREYETDAETGELTGRWRPA